MVCGDWYLKLSLSAATVITDSSFELKSGKGTFRVVAEILTRAAFLDLVASNSTLKLIVLVEGVYFRFSRPDRLSMETKAANSGSRSLKAYSLPPQLAESNI